MRLDLSDPPINVSAPRMIGAVAGRLNGESLNPPQPFGLGPPGVRARRMISIDLDPGPRGEVSGKN